MDEDRCQSRVGVPGRGDAADIPAIAGRERGQQGDGGVFGGMRSCPQLKRPPAEFPLQGLRDAPPHGLRGQGVLGAVERRRVEDLVGGLVASEVSGDLPAEPHVAEVDACLSQRPRAGLPQHHDVLAGLRLGVPGVVDRHHHRAAFVDVEFRHHE